MTDRQTERQTDMQTNNAVCLFRAAVFRCHVTPTNSTLFRLMPKTYFIVLIASPEVTVILFD